MVRFILQNVSITARRICDRSSDCFGRRGRIPTPPEGGFILEVSAEELSESAGSEAEVLLLSEKEGQQCRVFENPRTSLPLRAIGNS